MVVLLRALQSKLSRRLAGTGLALGAIVALASTALACTAIMGPLYMSPGSGPPGTVVSTTATGLKPFPAMYDLFFGGTCMSFTGKLLKTIPTNGQGGWTNVKVTIPKKAKPGTYSLCGVELHPSPGSTATTHSSWTVI